MFFKCRKHRSRETPWEVVGSYIIDPVPMFNVDDELDVKLVSNVVIGRTYTIDVRTWKGGEDISNALTFARRQFIQEILQKGYNVLLYESWRAIVYRRGRQHRVEIRYGGRPARVDGPVKIHHDAHPPCLGVLQSSI